MHFKISETVAATDVDLVVRTLEDHVRVLAKDVVRSEQQLIAFGIGPSPVVKNGKDRAVFHAIAVGAATCVTVDVSYQASGLLGGASQDEVVREKILGAFERTRTDLRFRGMEQAPPLMRSVARPVLVVPVVAEAPPIKQVVPAATESASLPAVVKTVAAAPVEVGAAKAFPAGMKVSEARPVAVEPASAKLSDDEMVGVQAAVVKRVEGESAGAAKVAGAEAGGFEARVGSKADGKALTESGEIALANLLRAQKTLDEREAERKTGWGALFLGWVAVIALGSGVGWLVIHPRGVESPTVEQTQSEGSVAEPVGAAADGVAETAVGVGSAAKVEEQDLNAWLLNWAEAMESHDAMAQTAFYADPVDWYFVTPHVGHARLQKILESAIDDNPQSTLKIEKIDIVKQTEDSASVRLVKFLSIHTGNYAPYGQRIKANLKVQRIDGDWKILEEHNLKPVSEDSSQ